MARRCVPSSPSQGATELHNPRRFSLKRAILAGVIVLLLAGAAATGSPS